MKCNGLEFAILPLLRQNRSGGISRRINLDASLAVWIIDSENRAGAKASLDFVKRLLLFLAPDLGCIACETIQRLADPAKVPNESLVEVRESAELPNIRRILQSGPVHDAFDLDGIHAYASVTANAWLRNKQTNKELTSG